MNDYKEMREGKILLNRFPYIECKDFRRQEQHEKENQYFLTNENGFFVKMYEAVGNPEADEVEITRYYPDSDNYEDAYKVLEEASTSGTHNLTVEIRREVKISDVDGWRGLMEPPLDFMTTDIHGNISEKETFHFPERKEIEELREKRWKLNESFPPRRRRGR